jgi:uncharacterized alpha-E superfamily protein
MLSRVAESIYWLNRYVERAENVARFLDVNRTLLLDYHADNPQQWDPLVLTTGDLAVFKERYGVATAENVAQFLTFDREYPNSIISCLRMARENARTVREVISSEMWEQVNGFYMMVRDASQHPVDQLLSHSGFYTQVKQSSHLFAGIMNATMSHNEGWNFGKIGQLLERADKTARILDVKYFILLPSVQDIGTALDEVQWMALLKSASAFEMYRKRDHRISPAEVAQFLILDREFPRSIRCCLTLAQQHLHAITDTPTRTWRNPAERTLGKLCADLDYVTIEDVFEVGLHEYLDRIETQINDISTCIHSTFFALQPV